MISFYIVFVSSLFAFIFTGKFAVISFVLFAVFASVSSVAKKLSYKGLSYFWIIVFAFYVWFMYDLLGLKGAIFATLCLIAGGLFGKEGVKRSGDIMFALGIILVVISMLFKGEKNVTAKEYFLPLSALSGISCVSVSGKPPKTVLVSTALGGLAGGIVYYGGGVFDEVYMYAALFAVGASHAAFVISGFVKA